MKRVAAHGAAARALPWMAALALIAAVGARAWAADVTSTGAPGGPGPGGGRASAPATGGKGGDGSVPGDAGGPGANVTLADVVSGLTHGALTLIQKAIGGGGGAGAAGMYDTIGVTPMAGAAGVAGNASSGLN